MHTERAGVAYRPPQSCLQGSEIRALIPEEDDRTSAHPAPAQAWSYSDSLEYRLPSRPGVVAGVPPAVERSFLPSIPSNLPTKGLRVLGSGAWWQDVWLQIQWPPQAQALSIAEKELIPIILACDTWGQ